MLRRRKRLPGRNLQFRRHFKTLTCVATRRVIYFVEVRHIRRIAMLKPVITATALMALAGASFAYAEHGFGGDRGFGDSGPRAGKNCRNGQRRANGNLVPPDAHKSRGGL